MTKDEIAKIQIIIGQLSDINYDIRETLDMRISHARELVEAYHTLQRLVLDDSPTGE
tara:strand:- start:403 stop:573 length:171 start_codon:yes stop_codon:yes gene_type:complete